MLRSDVAPFNVKPAWEYAERLQRMLYAIGDRYYIQTQIMSEWHNEHHPTGYPYGKWSMYLDTQSLDELAEEYREAYVPDEDSPTHKRAVACLTFLSVRRNEVGRGLAAIIYLRTLYLDRLTWVVALLLLLLLLVIWLVTRDVTGITVLSRPNFLRALWYGQLTIPIDSSYFRYAVAATVAGALGSVLSGFYKLRDQTSGLNNLRSFRSAMWAQPFVGAVVGVVLFLILKSSIIGITIANNTQEWAVYTVYGFVAGFSEPFFLGIVGRVVSAADDKKASNQPEKKPTPAPDPPPPLHSPPHSPP
jgi:hypothetical protein